MKTLCIVGSAPSWRSAPFNEDVEIWTLNSTLYKKLPRFDRQFDIHIPFIYIPENGEYKEFLKSCKSDLSILGKCSEFPDAKVINRIKLINKYGEYFTSSFAWILAQAIEEGYTEIRLYGVELKLKEEYEKQRACIEYFIGIARGKGIKVWIHPDSNLLKGDLYGCI